MSRDLPDLLAEALEAVQAGRSIEDVLTRWPEHAEALRPLLEAALLASRLRASEAPAEAGRRSRTRFLAAAHAAGPSRRSWPIAAGARRLAASLAILVAALLGAGGVTSAAAQALPGDALYPVKKAAEDLQLLFSADNQRRLELADAYAERRVEEVIRLLDLGRVVPLSFHGAVAQTGPVFWDVGGVTVRLTPQTRILGEILPGMTVEVEGITQTDRTFLAHRIHLHEYDLLGRLEARADGEIVVDGQALGLTPNTWLEPGLAPGDTVLVRVAIDDEGLRSVVSALRFVAPAATPVPASPAPTAAPPTLTATTTPAAGNFQKTPEASPDPSPDDDHDEGDQEKPTGEAEEAEFEGVVQTRGSTQWVISGRTVQITPATEIRDNPQVGDRVKVKAWVLPDGVWVARRIEVDD